jgi:hypothetical protein
VPAARERTPTHGPSIALWRRQPRLGRTFFDSDSFWDEVAQGGVGEDAYRKYEALTNLDELDRRDAIAEFAGSAFTHIITGDTFTPAPRRGSNPVADHSGL